MAISIPSGLTLNLISSVSVICLGSLQFGYHMAELNSPELVLSCKRSQPGPVPYRDSFFGRNGFKQCIPMTPDQIGLVTSIFSIGGLFGSFYVGHLADKYGRKKTSLLHCLLYIIGSTINGLSNTYASLLLGRFICGLGPDQLWLLLLSILTKFLQLRQKGYWGQ